MPKVYITDVLKRLLEPTGSELFHLLDTCVDSTLKTEIGRTTADLTEDHCNYYDLRTSGITYQPTVLIPGNDESTRHRVDLNYGNTKAPICTLEKTINLHPKGIHVSSSLFAHVPGVLSFLDDHNLNSNRTSLAMSKLSSVASCILDAMYINGTNHSQHAYNMLRDLSSMNIMSLPNTVSVHETAHDMARSIAHGVESSNTNGIWAIKPLLPITNGVFNHITRMPYSTIQVEQVFTPDDIPPLTTLTSLSSCFDLIGDRISAFVPIGESGFTTNMSIVHWSTVDARTELVAGKLGTPKTSMMEYDKAILCEMLDELDEHYNLWQLTSELHEDYDSTTDNATYPCIGVEVFPDAKIIVTPLVRDVALGYMPLDVSYAIDAAYISALSPIFTSEGP